MGEHTGGCKEEDQIVTTDPSAISSENDGLGTDAEEVNCEPSENSRQSQSSTTLENTRSYKSSLDIARSPPLLEAADRERVHECSNSEKSEVEDAGNPTYDTDMRNMKRQRGMDGNRQSSNRTRAANHVFPEQYSIPGRVVHGENALPLVGSTVLAAPPPLSGEDAVMGPRGIRPETDDFGDEPFVPRTLVEKRKEATQSTWKAWGNPNNARVRVRPASAAPARTEKATVERYARPRSAVK